MDMMTHFPHTVMPILNIIIILVIMLHHGRSDGISDDKDLFIVNVTMKDYQSTKEDEIIFVQYKLLDEEMTVVGFTPLVTTPTAHHMNTVACENPYSREPFWMDGQACGPGAQMLIYGWDRDALPFHLPEEVGIVVGNNTPYKYIVVNIHYLPIVKNDYSGNQLIISRKRRKYLAGVVTGGAYSIHLPPRTQTIKTPFSCQYNGPNISIFAAAVHAHQWARVNSMYRVRDGKITLIIKGDPQQTHQSYLLPSPIEILDGDYLVGQCVYDNDQDRELTFGLTHNNEMCNVLAGYSYESNDDKLNNGRVPLESCWGNQNPNLSALIPPDSEIPPKKSPDMDRIDQDEHATIITTGLSTQANRTKIFLIIVVVFGVAFLLVIAVIIRHLVCKKTLRGLDRLNTLINKETRAGPSPRLIVSSWLNRSEGFQRLEQSSDEENERVNNEV